MSLTPQQCKAARALLDWPQSELAKRSKVSASTLANFEAGKRVPYDRTLSDVLDVFAAAGIEFVSNERGEGVVKLRKADQV